MTQRHAVVSGASIAGLSTAFWLQRIGWRVSVVERAEQFREGGQNVDIRGVARDVLARSGLADAVRQRNTRETGTVLVDSSGAVITELPSDDPDGATAELEVLRGDLARILRDALPSEVEFVFGDVITEVGAAGPAPSASTVVRTRAGRTWNADLLVVAEGVRSSTRDLVFGDEVDRRPLDITMVFGTIDRTAHDDDRWRWYNAVGGRQVHLRPDPYGTTRAVLAFDRTEDLTRLDHDAAMAQVRRRYSGAGWESGRVVDGFATSHDVYLDHLTQIRMDRWHRDGVVVVGDAAWCVTPLGGGGASLALTGGYVLAAYLAGAGVGPLDDALTQFDRWMRPLVEDVQKLPPATHQLAYPKTRAGLRVRNAVMRLMTAPPFRSVTAKMTHVADTDIPLPPLAPVSAV